MGMRSEESKSTCARGSRRGTPWGRCHTGPLRAGFKDDPMAWPVVPFNDLRLRFAADPNGYRTAIERVFSRARYVLGPEVEAFETEFGEYLGGGHVVGVANGTDAIELALRAARIGPGDEVITVA